MTFWETFLMEHPQGLHGGPHWETSLLNLERRPHRFPLLYAPCGPALVSPSA